MAYMKIRPNPRRKRSVRTVYDVYANGAVFWDQCTEGSYRKTKSEERSRQQVRGGSSPLSGTC